MLITMLFLFVSLSCLMIGCFTCIQENLNKLFLYTLVGHLGYFFLFVTQVVTLPEGIMIPQEDVEIVFFYFFFVSFNSASFFIFVQSMRRSGNTYPMRSIYDFAQLWLIDKVVASCCLVLLVGLASIPFFPGFLCRWFFVQSALTFHPYLGILSFFTCLFSSYPYLRIMHQILFNSHFMLNEKGPRWYFDQLLSTKKKKAFLICTVIFALICIHSSFLWYFCHKITDFIFFFDNWF